MKKEKDYLLMNDFKEKKSLSEGRTYLQDKIILTISKSTTFTPQEIGKVFDETQSIDATIYVLNAASRLAMPLDEIICIIQDKPCMII